MGLLLQFSLVGEFLKMNSRVWSCTICFSVHLRLPIQTLGLWGSRSLECLYPGPVIVDGLGMQWPNNSRAFRKTGYLDPFHFGVRPGYYGMESALVTWLTTLGKTWTLGDAMLDHPPRSLRSVSSTVTLSRSGAGLCVDGTPPGKNPPYAARKASEKSNSITGKKNPLHPAKDSRVGSGIKNANRPNCPQWERAEQGRSWWPRDSTKLNVTSEASLQCFGLSMDSAQPRTTLCLQSNIPKHPTTTFEESHLPLLIRSKLIICGKCSLLLAWPPHGYVLIFC